MTNPINDELKPCPFCGGEAVLEAWPPNELMRGHVTCMDCDLTLSHCHTVEILNEQIERWNRRAPTGLECCANCAHRARKNGKEHDCPGVSVREIDGGEERSIPAANWHYCSGWQLAPAGWRREIEP